MCIRDRFYQIGNLPVYKLSVRTFEYSSEDLDTGIKEIDAIETAYTLDSLGFQLALEQTTTFNQGIRLEDNSGLIGIFETGSVSGYPGSTSSDKIIGEDEELNGAIIAENTSDSRSRINDADYSLESANLAKAQVLQQAGTAMLSQANARSQLVLQLLQ